MKGVSNLPGIYEQHVNNGNLRAALESVIDVIKVGLRRNFKSYILYLAFEKVSTRE